MNIPKISVLNFARPVKNDDTGLAHASKFGLTMAKPLSKDTVSFAGTPKSMGSRKDAITMKLAKAVHDEAKEALTFWESKLRPYLNDLEVITNPANPIESISARAKEPISIVEKAVTRGWNNKEEIKKGMTDLAGMKIIMRDGSKEEVNKVIDSLVDYVKETGARIVEIENKRPLPVYNQYGEIAKSYDYAAPMYLAKLQKVASKNVGKEIRYVDENTPTNYMAIHILTELPNGITGELQIMGHDVAALKELEDMCYKIKNGKNLPKKYASIEKYFTSLKPPVKPESGLEDAEYKSALEKFEFVKDEHLKYTQEAYLVQRAKEPRTYSSRRKQKDTFLEIPKYLPQELDFNNLHELKIKCDIEDAALKKAAAKKKK